MMSDILPFTPYDSMSYGTSLGATPDYANRAAVPQVTSRNDPSPRLQPTPQIAGPPMGAMGDSPNDAKIREAIALAKNQVAPEEGQEVLTNGKGTVASQDISNYKVNLDLLYIFLAVLFIDVVVIFLARFYPDFLGRNLNRWYDLFGLNAVICDVGIIVIGFILSRYIYTNYVGPKLFDRKWSAAGFTATTVIVQLIHDALFYLGVIVPIPRGHNLMMDVFKDYAEQGGAKILAGDAAMMVGSSVVAMFLKSLPMHATLSFGALVTYALPYILYTRNKFSVLR